MTTARRPLTNRLITGEAEGRGQQCQDHIQEADRRGVEPVMASPVSASLALERYPEFDELEEHMVPLPRPDMFYVVILVNGSTSLVVDGVGSSSSMLFDLSGVRP